jgi:hypothetical protein
MLGIEEMYDEELLKFESTAEKIYFNTGYSEGVLSIISFWFILMSAGSCCV